MSTCVDNYSSFSSSSIGSGGSFSKKKQYSAIVHVDPTPDQVIPITDKEKEDLKFELACQLVERNQSQENDENEPSFDYNDVIQNRDIRHYHYSSGSSVYLQECGNQMPLQNNLTGSQATPYHSPSNSSGGSNRVSEHSSSAFYGHNNYQTPAACNMYVPAHPNLPQQAGYPPLMQENYVMNPSPMYPMLPNHGGQPPMYPQQQRATDIYNNDYPYQLTSYDSSQSSYLDSRTSSIQIHDQKHPDSSDDEVNSDEGKDTYSFVTVNVSDIESDRGSLSIDNNNCGHECGSIDSDYSPVLTSDTKTEKESNQTASTQLQTSNRSKRTSNKPKVFITYAASDGDKQNAKQVLQITETLLRNGIQVNTDLMEQNVRSMSISEWLDNQISENDFVLVCISPQYKRVIEEGGEMATSKERALHTTYIYRRIHSEYIGNGSKNYRFLPLLINGGTAEHAPQWLLDTRIYKWPEEYESIIYRLYRVEKYVKPPIGRAPRVQVKRYAK